MFLWFLLEVFSSLNMKKPKLYSFVFISSLFTFLFEQKFHFPMENYVIYECYMLFGKVIAERYSSILTIYKGLTISRIINIFIQLIICLNGKTGILYILCCWREQHIFQEKKWHQNAVIFSNCFTVTYYHCPLL